MKLSRLLATRSALVRQAALANAAFAYSTLAHLALRIECDGLHGLVRLLGVDAAAGRFAPELIALTGSQAVIDEHFNDADILGMADAVSFAVDENTSEFEFRLEELLARFAPPLRAALRSAGVELDGVEFNTPGPRA